MTTFLACVQHPDRPGTCYDTYADEVLCAEDFPEETAYECEFVLGYIPERVHGAGRPTVEVDA